MNVDVRESPKRRESPEHTKGFESRFSRYRPLLYSTGMSCSWRYSRARRMLSKTAGGRLLATHQSLTMKGLFAIGWFECLSTKHCPLFERIANQI